MTRDFFSEESSKKIKKFSEQISVLEQEKEVLKERVRYLKSLIHNIQESIVVIDREYRITDANKAFIDHAASGDDTIIGKFCYEILHGYDQPCDRYGEECLLRSVFQTKKPGTCLHKHVLPDGSYVFVNLLYSPIKDKDGDVTQVIEAGRDVTDLLQAEARLIESEERYRNIFMNKYAPMFLIDSTSSDIVDANPAACKFYGYTKEELVQKKITDINTFDSAHMALEIEAAKREKREFLNFRHRLADGTVRDVEVYTGPIKINGRQLLFSIIHDITLRKKTEAALRDSEERYRTLTESISDRIWEVDTNGVYTYSSPKIYDLLGYLPEEAVGRSLFDFIPENEARKAVEFFRKALADRKEIRSFENVCLHKNGRRVVLETSIVPIFDPSGMPLGCRGIDRDITERKAAEDALKNARRELEQRVEERTRELKLKTQNLEEVNIALKVLLKRRDEDKIELEEKVLLNVKELVVSYIGKLKQSGLDEKQRSYIEIMETNLNDIVSPFLHGLSTRFLKLTPMEIQVANLVKQGKSTKEIADMINLSARTIEFHRDNIRKKMGIKHKKINLRTYLLSMQ